MGEQEAGHAGQGQGQGGRPDRNPPHTLHHTLWRLLHELAGATPRFDLIRLTLHDAP